MKRRDFIKAACCTAAAAAAGKQAMASLLVKGSEPSGKKPNIMFILADDLGIGGVSCYGGPPQFKTPNIDKLAREGTRFAHFYTAPLCGPSRALILTGRYAFRTGATNQDSTGLMKPTVETFMPTYLKQAGYASAMVGKWGQLPLDPAVFGFDEYLQFQGSGIYWNTQEKGKTYTVNGKRVPLLDKQYLPDVMHDFLIKFLEKHRNDPFYVYYSMSHVHAEILATPDSAPDSKDLYADNINYMDKLVGKLIAELERMKLRENTLVIFVGDNGTGGQFAAESTVDGKRESGEKGSMLEGGALVPMIVNWPGRTPAGRVSAEMFDSTDFVPTLAEIAGVKLPGNAQLDGHSFAPQIFGRKGNPRESIFIQLGPKWYVREADWKLNQEGHLYDMKGAPWIEPRIPDDTTDPAAIAARKRLQATLDKLDPAGGILDTGDGSGRHRNAEKNHARKAAQQKREEQ
jgi:arylsulfatase A